MTFDMTKSADVQSAGSLKKVNSKDHPDFANWLVGELNHPKHGKMAIALKPVEKRESAKAPFFDVIQQCGENGNFHVGGAWKKLDKNQDEYLSLSLRNEGQGDIIYASAFENDDKSGYRLS